MPRKDQPSHDAETSGAPRGSPQGADRPQEAWLDNPLHIRSFFEAVDRARQAKKANVPPSERTGGTPTRS
jgi:hypothetical protein